MILRNALFTLLATVGFLLFVWQCAPVRAGEVCGLASWYGVESCVNKRDCRTANGERYTGRDLTAAHRSLPFGTKLRVTYGERSLVVRVNDRGNFHKYGRILDLSRAAAVQLGMERRGVASVCLQVTFGQRLGRDEVENVTHGLNPSGVAR